MCTASGAALQQRRISNIMSSFVDKLQVLIHPRWGTSVYPATLFTKAPVNVLKKVIEEVESESTDTGYYQNFMSI